MFWCYVVGVLLFTALVGFFIGVGWVIGEGPRWAKATVSWILVLTMLGLGGFAFGHLVCDGHLFGLGK